MPMVAQGKPEGVEDIEGAKRKESFDAIRRFKQS